MLKARLRPRRVSPRLPALPFQRAVPITPVNRTGACVDCFPVRTAFPAMRSGRHSHRNFRGVLRLHTRYRPLDCSAAQSDLCHEASTPSDCSSKPLVSYQINRQFSGWILPPLVIRAVGAHRKASHGTAASAGRHAPCPGACAPTRQNLRKPPFLSGIADAFEKTRATDLDEVGDAREPDHSRLRRELVFARSIPTVASSDINGWLL
jgi:hypothetical protein